MRAVQLFFSFPFFFALLWDTAGPLLRSSSHQTGAESVNHSLFYCILPTKYGLYSKLFFYIGKKNTGLYQCVQVE